MDLSDAARWEKLCLELIETRKLVKSKKAKELDGHQKFDVLRNEYKKKTKDVLGRCISSVYLNSLLDSLPDDSENKSKPDRRIGQALDRSPSTLFHWRKGHTLPDPANFFVAITIFNLPLCEIPDPPREQVIVQAVCRAVQYIREKDLRRRPCSFSPDDLICVNLIYQLPRSQLLAITSESDRRLKRSVLDTLRDKLHCRVQKDDVITDARIEELVREFLIAYALFDFGRPMWNILNEIET